MNIIQNSVGNSLVINDSNLQYYIKYTDAKWILQMDKNYNKIIFNCIVPPRLDIILPFSNENGTEINAEGDFILNGQLVHEAHLMLWHNNWWDRTTR